MNTTNALRAASYAVLLSAFGPIVSPAVAQAPSFTQVGTIHGPANLIEIEGSLAYVVGEKTLTLYDIKDPAKPARLGSHSFPEKIWGIRIVGPLVYVAADFFGLGIVDVSDPMKPVLRGAVKTPGQAKNVAVVGTTALVADHMSGIDIIDVSNGASPKTRESYFLEGYARDVTSAGTIAYAIDAPAGLYVFDLSRTGPTEPVSSQQSARAPASIELSNPKTAGGTPIAVLTGGGLIQIYDLSKPLEPVRAATLKTPSGRPTRSTLHGSHVYVADGREGVQVVDVSKPAAPALVGTGFKTPQPARDVAVAGSHLFVVVGAGEEEGEVLILHRTN